MLSKDTKGSSTNDFLVAIHAAESTTGTYLQFADQLLALSFQRFTELVEKGFGSLLFRHIAMASYTTLDSLDVHG